MTKKRMLVICPFPQGVAAGQRLKYEQYFSIWRQNDWDIDISSFMDKKMWEIIYKQGNYFEKFLGTIRGHFRRLFDISRVHKYDVVYIFMYVTPLMSSFMERMVRISAKRVIYDIEDNVVKPQNSIIQPNPITKYLKWPGKYQYLIRSCDHVITSSPFLNIDCKRLTSKGFCSYISSSVDTDKFLPKSEYLNDKIVTIGWTGTYSSKEYLDLLKDVFYKLNERVKFKLKIICNFEYTLPGINLEVIQWSLKNEVLDLQSLDIGIYPLPSNEWVHGKSGLKAIQYMSIGLPCVATNVGTTPMIITDKVNGRLVETEDEWVDALEDLIKSPKKRQSLGEQARRDAVAKYSLHAISSMYNNILNNVMEKHN